MRTFSIYNSSQLENCNCFNIKCTVTHNKTNHLLELVVYIYEHFFLAPSCERKWLLLGVWRLNTGCEVVEGNGRLFLGTVCREEIRFTCLPLRGATAHWRQSLPLHCRFTSTNNNSPLKARACQPAAGSYPLVHRQIMGDVVIMSVPPAVFGF